MATASARRLRSLGRYIAQAICALAFLPDEAYYSLDAVLRTLMRLILTKRNLLQWRTSTDAEQGARTDLAGTLRAMWVAPISALLLGGYRCPISSGGSTGFRFRYCVYG